MNPKLPLETRTFPSRIADLGFRTQLPVSWIAHDLPKEEVDFTDPTRFFPLAIVTAPHAAIIFAFVARPAYESGTLEDWATFLLNHNQIKPRAIGTHAVGNLAAIMGEAVQDSDVGPVILRFAFIEDGGRLLNLTLIAPELLADSVQSAWVAMLESFKLETPRGTRFPADLSQSGAPAPVAEPAVTAATTTIAALPVDLSASAVKAQAKKKLGDFALKNDTTSLDPENSINTNLRDRGVGLVPNVAATNDAAKRATISAGAVVAQFDVPYGWHVIDDGKRTLIFEPSGKVQINLNLVPRKGRNHAAILDDIETQAREDYPKPEFTRILEGTIHALGIRNISDGGQPLEQYHFLFPFCDETMVLRARVTATPDQATDACNLTELILDSVIFDRFQRPAESNTSTGTHSGGLESQLARNPVEVRS